MHDLDALNLTSIPPEVYELTDLTELSARENSLTELPSNLTKLSNLEVLWVHENNISEISPAIGQLKNLKELWLNDNSIPRLPNEICFLGALTDLRLHSNKLTLLPNEFGLLTSLTRLSISDNQLIGLPASVANLTSLKKLVANNNRFAVFPQGLPGSLTNIDFSNNKIGGEVPPPNMMTKLANVRKLRLSNNLIFAIPGEIGSMAKLEVLSLSSNQLFTLPPSLGACTGLRVLELDDNKVDYLPPEISIMTRLEKLGVNNTSFLNVPPGVVKKGQKAIVKYFQDFRQETRDCCRIKLMVVGQENVGKSTLLQALRNTTKTLPDHGTPLSTDGIDIVTWKVKPDKSNNKKIEFSCWDFAGQEVYYNTHQFFLSKNAIYVLVWNLARPDTARLDFWLESIEGSGGGVVVMVGTHLTDPICTTEYLDAHFASIEEQCLKKFPNIRFVSAVDAKKGQGIEELKKNLVELARTLPQFGKAMPSSYIRLEEAIEKEAKTRDPPIMTWHDYKILAVSCSINDDETLANATQFFHNLGSLIHFPSRHSGLADLVILKPQFLPNLMCTIISTKATFIKNGVLEHKDLSFVWKKYNKQLFSHFILLLEKFGILCRLQEESSSNKLSVVFISPGGGSPPGSPTNGRRSLSIILPSPPPSPTVSPRQSPPSSPTVKNYTTTGSMPSSPSSMSGSLKKRLSLSGGMEKPKAALDAEKSLIPLLLEHNPEIEKLAKHVQRDNGTLGRDFYFRIIIPSLFPRLIVSVLTYSRLASRRGLLDIIATTEKSSRTLKKEKNIRVEYSGYRWKVEYGKDQLYVARRDSYALATFSQKERKLSVLVWGNNTTRMLALITQSVEFLLEDCFPNHKFTISVVCPHCLANNVAVPKKWPITDLETQLLTEGDTATVLCDNISEGNTRSPDKSLTSSSSTPVLVREMIPDLALNEVPKINFEDLKMECQIGEGAFGEIWRAQYKGRVVAIKKVRGAGDSMDNNKDSFTEFVREVAFMSQMHSPEMVQLIGVGLKPLSMMQEYMELGDLQKYLRNMGSGRLDLKTVARIAFDISKGCQFLHSQTPPCIHADLKSPNILLSHNEKGEIVAKLGDLGLSRSVFAPLNKRMVDNPRWLAPEILASQEYNEMADVYSYGIILWEIVTTYLDKYQEPFEEFRLNFDSLLEVHIMQGLRPTIPIGTPHELGTVINDCWQPNYFERPTFDGVALTMSNYCLSVK